MGLHDSVVGLNVEEGFGDYPEAATETEGLEEGFADDGMVVTDEDWSDFPEVEQ